MNQRIRLLLLILGGAVACAGCPKPLPGPVPPNDGDAAAPARADRPASCSDLCSLGTALGCDWSADTRAGAHCEDVCLNATSGGPLVWNLECRVGNLMSGRGCHSVDLCP